MEGDEKPGRSQGNRRFRGFEPTGALLAKRIRAASEPRGFPITRLLTHWDEIAGPEFARATRPLKVTYGGGNGFGATLLLLVSGAVAPLVQASLPALRERVNAVYGYDAIRHIRLTQTSGEAEQVPLAGFAETAPDWSEGDFARHSGAARQLTGDVGDATLREALAALGERILTRAQTKDRKP